MKPRWLVPSLLVATATAFAQSPAVKPQSVSVVDVPTERRDYATHIGNVKVRFADGHTEIWTKDGRCLIPHVSVTGLVGWTYYTRRNSYREPFNDLLRVRFPDGTQREFRVGLFIEDWGFSEDNAAVIIKCRGRHGPAYYFKCDIRTAEVVDSVTISAQYNDLPAWAKPYADDKPRA